MPLSARIKMESVTSTRDQEYFTPSPHSRTEFLPTSSQVDLLPASSQTESRPASSQVELLPPSSQIELLSTSSDFPTEIPDSQESEENTIASLPTNPSTPLRQFSWPKQTERRHNKNMRRTKELLNSTPIPSPLSQHLSDSATVLAEKNKLLLSPATLASTPPSGMAPSTTSCTSGQGLRPVDHNILWQSYTPTNTYIPPTSTDRTRIRTAFEWGHTSKEIQAKYAYSARQIRDALRGYDDSSPSRGSRKRKVREADLGTSTPNRVRRRNLSNKKIIRE